MPKGLEQPIFVFCSYSHRDEPLRDELSKHMSVLKRQGVISEWQDRQISPGDKWAEEIDERINQAQIILLLISSDFLASDYCYEIEMKRALDRNASDEAVVIPVILRPCNWQDAPFGQLQSLPRDAKPVTTWPNQDEAFTNIESGIREAVNRLRPRATQPVAPRNPGLLEIERFGEEIVRQDVKEIKVANPYLLGDNFVGREKELGDLTNWLRQEESGILCICDLGGTGKSALIWRWLNSESTRDVLIDRGIKQFWCSFYATNFDSIQFLRDLANQLGGTLIDETDTFIAQMKLQRYVLDRLSAEKWLLALDGLEREMGAFVNPEHYQVDSEEQDRRNEEGAVQVEEKYIRSHVFADFLRELLKTQTKVLVTSRLFPENLIEFGDRPLHGVIRYPFSPMSLEDAARVWNLSGEPDGSSFQREFFESVGFHPQVISVVAAAVKEQSWRFNEWFSEFSEAERRACLDVSAPMTARRHRWLDLATRDLIQNPKHRDAWLTICYIVRRSQASSVDVLMDSLVDSASPDEARPGRFRSEVKLREALNYLAARRLIGIGSSLEKEMVDVHPVIRGQVMRHILKQYAPGVETDEDLVRHMASDGDHRDLMIRFLNQPNLEERLQSLSSVLEEFSDIPSPQSAVLNILGKFYADARTGGRAWLDALPALRLRKDQAWVLLRTGNELMARGLWDESSVVFNRARIAYHLCGDLESVEDCRHSHDWQTLYGGALLKSEQRQMDLLEQGGSQREEYAPYWLALLLSIRRSEHAAEVLQSLPTETNRWTLQTVAEAWFYLEDYEKAASLAQQALDRREEEIWDVAQLLWEKVTLGLALVRMGRGDEAVEHLDFAKSRGTGWSYNLVPMFALAGLIEFHYLEAIKTAPGPKRMEQLLKADLVYKQYCKSDPNDGFQIPAAEAHFAMARAELARANRDEALKLAERSLAIARGRNALFHYASVVRRATRFLSEELKQPAAPIEEPDLEALDHEERLRNWVNAWQAGRNRSVE